MCLDVFPLLSFFISRGIYIYNDALLCCGLCLVYDENIIMVSYSAGFIIHCLSSCGDG